MTVIVGSLTPLIGTLDFLMTALASIFDCPSEYVFGICTTNVCESGMERVDGRSKSPSFPQ